jgi:hypothetical protein
VRSFPASPRYVGQPPVFRMLPSSLLSARGYAMRRCWKNWPHAMWTMSPHSSLWLTSVPEPPRAVLGTRHHRWRLQRRVTRMSSPRAEAGRKRKSKNHGHEKPQFAISVATATAGGQVERGKRPRHQGYIGDTCPVHPKSCHQAADCREIIKLARSCT